ncbi:MAG: hypothetical protein V4850_26810 [Myxococcota bacterium]
MRLVITNRFYAILFGAPLLLVPTLGAAVSGGDLGFVGFFFTIGLATVALIMLLSLPFVRMLNAWQSAPLTLLARRVEGRVVATIGGDRYVRMEGGRGGNRGDAVVVFYVATAETAGGNEDTPGTPWTCVASLRPGRRAPAVEVQLLPDGSRAVRWSNRWWDLLGRRAPADPVVTERAHAAQAALRALSPGAECRLRYGGDLAAFAAPGHISDPDALAVLVEGARGWVGGL